MKRSKLLIASVALLLAVPAFALPANPPVLSSISPTSATAGVGFILTVYGSNFTTSSVILWNGTVQTTTYVNNSRLTAAISNALVSSAGTATVAVHTGGKSGATSNSLAFTINPAPGSTTTTTTNTPLTITTASLPAGTAGTAYSTSLAASGGTTPYSWSLISGNALPGGLTLANSGAISGTPTTSGSFAFGAQVNDSAGHVASYTYSLSIGASATLTCSSGLTGCPLSSPTACYNLQTDPSNCGSCGNVCGGANVATTACTSGVCVISACAAGYADCDHSYSDGCETNLITNINNCGACGNVCGPVANAATTACTSGACTLTCNAGYADCDHNYANGCETNLTTINNCGACGNVCGPVANAATTACTFGACTLTCNAGYADCDHNYADGCETNLASDVNNCGACGHVCASGQSCVSGACQ